MKRVDSQHGIISSIGNREGQLVIDIVSCFNYIYTILYPSE